MDHHWLLAEFMEAARAVLGTTDDPQLAGLRVTHVEAGPLASIIFEGAPVLDYDDGDGVTQVDASPILKALAWTLMHRARRFANRETYGPDDVNWRDVLRSRYPGRFACEMSANSGWADLMFAMAEQIEALEPGPRFAFTQIKEKYGTLSAYHRGFTDPVSDMVDAFEAASGGICETCGSPGVLRSTRGGWYRTACEVHAREAYPVTADWPPAVNIDPPNKHDGAR